MGDVLSQSQIDALLNAALSGGGDQDKKSGESARKERKYDFRTPKRFTKDQLKILDSVFTTFSRIITSHLTSILRLPVSVEMLDVEEQKYNEFNNALAEYDIISLINPKIENSEFENEQFLVQMSESTIRAMMDRVLGGSGEAGDIETAGFTDIELEVYNKLTSHLITPLTNAWNSHFDISFELSGVETNPRLMQILGIDDVVVIVVLDITVNNTNGKITICMPGSTLEVVFRMFEATKMISRRRDLRNEKATEDIMYNISGSTLDIKVDLGEATAGLSDILCMRVGDVINLHKPAYSEAIVYIEETPWFTGELGTDKHNLAVRINGLITNN